MDIPKCFRKKQVQLAGVCLVFWFFVHKVVNIFLVSFVFQIYLFAPGYFPGSVTALFSF